MGGRGATSNFIKRERVSIQSILNVLGENSQEDAINALSNYDFVVSPAEFTKNGNAISLQWAELASGNDRIELSFHNHWDPMQVTRPTKPIKQAIEVRIYKNGNIDSLRVLAEKKSSSLKNAEKNYNELLNLWKNLTKQKNIIWIKNLTGV